MQKLRAVESRLLFCAYFEIRLTPLKIRGFRVTEIFGQATFSSDGLFSTMLNIIIINFPSLYSYFSQALADSDLYVISFETRSSLIRSKLPTYGSFGPLRVIHQSLWSSTSKLLIENNQCVDLTSIKQHLRLQHVSFTSQNTFPFQFWES